MSSKYNIIFIIVLIILLFIFIIQKPIELNAKPVVEGLAQNEFIAVQNQLLIKDYIPLKKNWAVTFTMKLYSGSNGNWQQILGITPHSDGTDARIFAVWLCPSGNTLHIMTATQSNNNTPISNCSVSVPINQYVRINVVSNTVGKKQYITADMTNLDTNATSQLASTSLDAALYSPTHPYNRNAFVFTTYNWCNVINGTLKDVAFIVSDDNINKNDLNKAVNYSASLPIRSGFTTMTPIVEGLSAIGGTGNNGGILGYTPPPLSNEVNSHIEDPLTKGYKPIKDDKGNDICTKSVFRSDDLKASGSSISSNGYNYKVNDSLSVPVCSPDDLYLIQKQILKEINLFNNEYSDFVTYKYNDKHKLYGDTSLSLTYVDNKYNDESAKNHFNSNSKNVPVENITDLDTYTQLMQDLQTYNYLLQANKEFYPDPESTDTTSKIAPLSKIDPIQLQLRHKEIVNFRSDLDKKLFELNNVQNSAAGQSKMQMDSSIYVNILWTTLATCVVYFFFV